MGIELININGNPNVGVYIFANNKFALIPPGLTQKTRKLIEDALNVEAIEVRIADMTINGVMVAGNNKGLLLPRLVRPDEFDEIRSALAARLGLRCLTLGRRPSAT